MSRSLRRTERALDDLADIWEYIAHDNPAAAEKLVGDILKLFERTAEFPLLGRAAHEIAAGHGVLTHGRYLLIYCLYEDEEAVELVRVIHSARDWPPLFDS